MSKKWIFISFSVVFILIAGGSAGFFLTKKSKDQKNLEAPIITSKIKEVNEETTYNDASGFSFKYPQSANVHDVTPQDSSYYSVLELASAERSGKIILTVKDTKFSDVDTWLSNDSVVPKTATSSGVSSIGNIPAKKYEVMQGKEQLLLTAAVEDGVLYSIEGPKDNGFWEKTYSNLLFSFAISKPTSVSAATAQDDGTTYEVEEEIQ